MKVYTPAALALLVATALALGSGLRHFDHASLAALVAGPIEPNEAKTLFQFMNLIFGFFAMPALAAIDWGRVVESERDIEQGGVVGVAFGGGLTPILGLLCVAGAVGGLLASQEGAPDQLGALRAAIEGRDPLTFHWAIEKGIGGRIGATLLILFGMATLAPACYSAHGYGRRFHDCWFRLGRRTWTWIGAIPAVVLVATAWAERTELIFTIMGALFAPAIGSLVADYRRQRGRWGGFRSGINPAGLIAWLVGASVGLIPLIGAWFRIELARNVQPATILAFATGYLVYEGLARFGMERALIALPSVEQPSRPA
jgi:cytosine permease